MIVVFENVSRLLSVTAYFSFNELLCHLTTSGTKIFGGRQSLTAIHKTTWSTPTNWAARRSAHFSRTTISSTTPRPLGKLLKTKGYATQLKRIIEITDLVNVDGLTHRHGTSFEGYTSPRNNMCVGLCVKSYFMNSFAMPSVPSRADYCSLN